MKYTSELDSNNGICKVNVTGDFHRPVDSNELKRFAIEFYNNHGCHLFLFDLRQAEVLSGTISAYRASKTRAAVTKHLRKFRAAFVRRELTEGDFFYENLSVNRGFQLRAFDSVEMAEWWLLKSKA
jgi:hypothetical protein